jgi:hypothetical protein
MNKLLIAAVLGVFVLAACGEREQVAEGKRTYQGKRDTKAWDNDPPGYATSGTQTWKKGDEASWEQAIKTRQMSQNEYQRIGR